MKNVARKAVLEGGKRDEIIRAAEQQFFSKGYEATSIRSILAIVGGEIGMFYYYFQSKDELFNVVVERFFADYRQQFDAMAISCVSLEDFTECMLAFYDSSMEKFRKISPSLHWTIQYSLHTRTLAELLTGFQNLLVRLGALDGADEQNNLITAQLLAAISATLHNPTFSEESIDKRKQELLSLAERFLEKGQ